MSATRKPIDLEMVGKKSPRQRLWEAVREHRDSFTWPGIVKATGIKQQTARKYLQALHKGGYIAEQGEATGNARCFVLLRDVGSEAPILKADGTPSKQGLGAEAMWRTLRIMGEVDAEALAEQASVCATVSLATAKHYLKWLKAAGYVIETSPATYGKGARLACYRLPRDKYTGPKPPVIQRNGQVFDPNIGTVVYSKHEEASSNAS